MDDIIEVIARALTSVDREFAVRVGTGQVAPGSYITDRDRAVVIARELTDAGLVVTPGA